MSRLCCRRFRLPLFLHASNPESAVKPTSAPSPSIRDTIILLAKIALVVGILGYLGYDLSQNGKLDQLLAAKKQWGWVGLGVFACVAAHVIGFIRWRMMIRALAIPFTLFDSIRIGLIGLFFGIFAFGVVGGDTLRAFYVTRRLKSRRAEAITSVLADRLVGILTMFVIASVAFCFFEPEGMDEEKLSAIRFLGWFVTACTLAGLTGVVFLFVAPVFRASSLFQWFLNLPKLGDLLEKLLGVITLYRSRPATLVGAFLMSVGVNVCFAISIYSLAVGLTTGSPRFLDHFIIEPIAMVSNAIPVPGGIGTMEMAMKFLYLAFGSDNGVVVGFTYRFALLSVSTLGAFVWFWNREQVEEFAASAADSKCH